MFASTADEIYGHVKQIMTGAENRGIWIFLFFMGIAMCLLSISVAESSYKYLLYSQREYKQAAYGYEFALKELDRRLEKQGQ